MFYVIWYFSRFSRVYYLPRLEIFHEVWGRCLFTTNLVSKMFTCQMSLNTFYVRFFVIMTCKWTAMVYILYFFVVVLEIYILTQNNTLISTAESMRIKGHLFFLVDKLKYYMRYKDILGLQIMSIRILSVYIYLKLVKFLWGIDATFSLSLHFLTYKIHKKRKNED